MVSTRKPAAQNYLENLIILCGKLEYQTLSIRYRDITLPNNFIRTDLFFYFYTGTSRLTVQGRGNFTNKH